MKNFLRICIPLMLLALAGSAYGQSSNVCGETPVTAGGSFTWTSTYSVAIRVEPFPGTTWFLGQSYVEIPANGSVTVIVPTDAATGTSDPDATFDQRAGGNPCGDTPGMPHLQVNP